MSISHYHCRRKFSSRASKSASASFDGPPPAAAAACGVLALAAVSDSPVDGKPITNYDKKVYLPMQNK